MKPFKNSRKDNFISTIPTASINADDDLLTMKCKFNFAYFDVQTAGQSFEQWTDLQRLELVAKLKEYSKETLQYWRNMPIGKGGGTVLSIYGAFPLTSKFSHPKHVPHEVCWGRFRLDFSGRLIGFVLPQNCDGEQHPGTKKRFDCNTFYIVFLDANHEFYIGKEVK